MGPLFFCWQTGMSAPRVGNSLIAPATCRHPSRKLFSSTSLRPMVVATMRPPTCLGRVTFLAFRPIVGGGGCRGGVPWRCVSGTTGRRRICVRRSRRLCGAAPRPLKRSSGDINLLSTAISAHARSTRRRGRPWPGSLSAVLPESGQIQPQCAAAGVVDRHRPQRVA